MTTNHHVHVPPPPDPPQALEASKEALGRRTFESALFKVILGIVGLAVMANSLRLGIGSLSAPGPGLWPGLAGLGMLLSALHLLVFDRGSAAEPLTRNSWKVPVALVSLVVFGLALAYFGLVGPVFVLMVVWLKLLGDEPWLLSAAISLVTSAALYLLFVTVLGVPFPPDLVLGLLGLEGV